MPDKGVSRILEITGDDLPTESQDQLPAADLDSLIARTGGDSELILEMIRMFQKEAPRLYGQVITAIQNNDAVSLRSAAHALKGSVANFSANPAMNAAAVLEESGKNGDMSNVSLSCSNLSYEIDRLQLELAEFVNKASQ